MHNAQGLQTKRGRSSTGSLPCLRRQRLRHALPALGVKSTQLKGATKTFDESPPAPSSCPCCYLPRVAAPCW